MVGKRGTGIIDQIVTEPQNRNKDSGKKDNIKLMSYFYPGKYIGWSFMFHKGCHLI